MIGSVGSYYSPSAVGGQPSTPSEWVNETAAQLLAAVNPIGVFTPWSHLDGSVWQYIEKPDTDFSVFAITDSFLKQIEIATTGNQLSFVGVFSDKSIKPQDVDAAFLGTRYKFFSGDALYRQDDPASPPKPWFIYWAVLRNDSEQGAGQGSLQSAASKLSGQLVYVFPTVRGTSSRPHPSVGVSDLPVSTPTFVVEAASAVSQVPWWLVVLTGGLAAYGGFRWYRRRKR